ncbi:hypothetical protein LTR86_001784 [Recurvomyces mirabilis]|nr:hypothetical protein LTR86_001784 [Recurvomyces mirabilis]
MAAIVAYHTWPKADLVELAQARSLKPTSTAKISHQGPLREDYVKAHQDFDASFERGKPVDFVQKLPPELRLRIYEELLTFRPGIPNACPTILTVSKQIHAEASSIWHDKISGHESSRNEGETRILLEQKHVLVAGKRYGRHSCDSWPDKHERDMLTLLWPNLLRRAQRVRFVIRLSDLEYQQLAFWPPNDPDGRRYRIDDAHLGPIIDNVLYSLCSFLQGKHDLRSFVVELDDRTHRVNAVHQAIVFNALQLLGTVPEIIFEHNRVALGTHRDTTWTAHTPLTGGLLARIEALFEEAMAYADLESATYHYYDAEIKWDTFSDNHRSGLGYKTADAETEVRMRDLLQGEDRNRVELVKQMMVGRVFCDHEWEAGLRTHLDELERLLAELDVDEIEGWAETANKSGKYKVKKFLRCREARMG